LSASRHHNGSHPGPQPATVIGRWGDDTALLRTEDGTTVEVPVPVTLRDRIDVGASVEVLDDGLVDWRVPDRAD
jgi:hypothetical protein